MFSNWSWMSFLAGGIFVMFVWPFLVNLFTKMTAKTSTKAAS